MSAKKITILGVFTAVAVAFSFLESLINLSFIAPGIKIGIANSVTLLLISSGHKKEAAATSLCRIIISNTLFGTPITFLYALLGSAFSYAAMLLVRLNKNTSPFIVGVFGGIFHNSGQAVAAIITFGSLSFLYFLPELMLFGCIFGAITGTLSVLLMKNKNIYILLKSV